MRSRSSTERNAAGGDAAALECHRIYGSDYYGWNRVFLVFAASYFLGALRWLRIDATESVTR